jgi:pimeloyl-ACP methyl ester carboxylesterase
MTGDLRRRFATVRGPERWSVLGISLGGMVALDWCSRFPTDFETCVAINASSRLSPSTDRFRAGGVLALATAVLGTRVARERAVLRVSSNARTVDREAVAREYAQWAAERPPSLASVACQLAAAWRFEVRGPMTTPLLVLSSTRDRLVSWQCSQAIATALDAPLRLHVSAGHDLTLDDPEWVRAEIVQWLEIAWAKRRDQSRSSAANQR